MPNRNPIDPRRASVRLNVRVGRADVALFDALLEGCEGLATVGTVDRDRSVLRVEVPAAFETTARALLAALGGTVDLEVLSEDEGRRYDAAVTGPRPRKPAGG